MGAAGVGALAMRGSAAGAGPVAARRHDGWESMGEAARLVKVRAGPPARPIGVSTLVSCLYQSLGFSSVKVGVLVPPFLVAPRI